ncbi:hypothetical protein M2092_001767 [Fusobacterium sp. PH5-44]
MQEIAVNLAGIDFGNVNNLLTEYCIKVDMDTYALMQ